MWIGPHCSQWIRSTGCPKQMTKPDDEAGHPGIVGPSYDAGSSARCRNSEGILQPPPALWNFWVSCTLAEVRDTPEVRDRSAGHPEIASSDKDARSKRVNPPSAGKRWLGACQVTGCPIFRLEISSKATNIDLSYGATLCPAIGKSIAFAGDQMAVTIKDVVEAFDLLFASVHRKEFCKTLRLKEFTEQELHPLVRSFLLGYFGESLIPEAKAILPGSLSGVGRFDYLIGNVAVELAVRNKGRAKANISSSVNTNEVKKLMKHDGLSLLVLLDFSESPANDADISRFRDWPSLGKGSHKKSSFNVAYFYKKPIKKVALGCITKNIRVE
jgi:hypothetical protein